MTRTSRFDARRGLARAVSVACALGVASVAPASAQEQWDASDSGWSEAAANDDWAADTRSDVAPYSEAEPEVTLGSFVATALYAPLKIAYAAGGVAAGGLAWVFSAGDTDATRAVALPAVRGDYILTPEHLDGRREIVFVGREPAPESNADGALPSVSSGPPGTDWDDAWPGDPDDFAAPGADSRPDEGAAASGNDSFWLETSDTRSRDAEARWISRRDAQRPAEPVAPRAAAAPAAPRASNDAPRVWVYEPGSASQPR